MNIHMWLACKTRINKSRCFCFWFVVVVFAVSIAENKKRFVRNEQGIFQFNKAA